MSMHVSFGGTVGGSVRASPFETAQCREEANITDEERREAPAPLDVANECAPDERVRNAETTAEELNHLTCQRSRRRFTLSAWAARPLGGCDSFQIVDRQR
jgi:hypothetical protein